MDNFQFDLPSIFTYKTIQDLHREILATYRANNYPWVVGYSGGKDSTATLQLIWNALVELPVSERTKPVFVISSDTLVETPVVVEQINTTLKLIEEKSVQLGLPFTTKKVSPSVQDTFWVRLIGMGYPAPSRRFRWCTERMKIKPANTFILETAARLGEVVMILGARKVESMSRAQVMNKREFLPGTHLSRHSSLARAWVYTPIEDFTTDDVWLYLLQVPSPWGGSNRDLAAMYRRSQTGECPLVVDTSTPSCGNSRFGCWVCTVVEKDRTMQSLIDSGEEWMEPLLEFRDKLAETQDPEKKREYREYKRRDGRTIVKDGKTIPGPYRPEVRQRLLRELLQLQLQIQRDGPDPDLTLITDAELHEIRRIWRAELSDWADTLPQIYREVMGKDLNWVQDEGGAFSMNEFAMIEEECERLGLPTALVTRLIDLERQMQGMARRSGLYHEIHRIFEEEWSSEADVLRRAAFENARQMDLGLD